MPTHLATGAQKKPSLDRVKSSYNTSLACLSLATKHWETESRTIAQKEPTGKIEEEAKSETVTKTDRDWAWEKHSRPTQSKNSVERENNGQRKQDNTKYSRKRLLRSCTYALGFEQTLCYEASNESFLIFTEKKITVQPKPVVNLQMSKQTNTEQLSP